MLTLAWPSKLATLAEFGQLLQRSELDKSGVYILFGTDPLSGSPHAYIGEAEVIRDRLKQHKTKDFWVSVIVFVRQGEDLQKGHVRYLEGRLISEAIKVGRFTLENSQSGGSKLPEAETANMEDFFARIQQLLPVLGSELFVPIAPQQPANKAAPARLKGARPIFDRSACSQHAQGVELQSDFEPENLNVPRCRLSESGIQNSFVWK